MTITQRKFLIIVGINILTFISFWWAGLPATVLENIIIWANGLYFGVNAGQKIGLEMANAKSSKDV